MEVKKTDDNDIASVYSFTMDDVTSLEDIQGISEFKELTDGKDFEADYDTEDPKIIWVTIMK